MFVAELLILLLIIGFIFFNIRRLKEIKKSELEVKNDELTRKYKRGEINKEEYFLKKSELYRQ